MEDATERGPLNASGVISNCSGTGELKLDFIFHGGANLNARMYHTAGFDDVCRKAFERWHLRIEGNASFKDGRFLDMPVTEDARLAIRTFWVKQAGARAECFYLGVRLTKDSYREAGEYYRLVAALRALSIASVKEFVSSGQRLDLALTMPLRRQSMWRPFSELSGTRMIGAEKFDEQLEDILLSVSVSNLDDWFNKMCLAINPAVDRQEFNLVVSKTKPKMGCGECSSPVVAPAPATVDRTAARSVKMFFNGLTCGIGAASIGAFCFWPDNGSSFDDGYKRGFESGYKQGVDSQNRPLDKGKSPSFLTKAQESITGVVTNGYKCVKDVVNDCCESVVGTNDAHSVKQR